MSTEEYEYVPNRILLALKRIDVLKEELKEKETEISEWKKTTKSLMTKAGIKTFEDKVRGIRVTNTPPKVSWHFDDKPNAEMMSNYPKVIQEYTAWEYTMNPREVATIHPELVRMNKDAGRLRITINSPEDGKNLSNYEKRRLAKKK